MLSAQDAVSESNEETKTESSENFMTSDNPWADVFKGVQEKIENEKTNLPLALEKVVEDAPNKFINIYSKTDTIEFGLDKYPKVTVTFPDAKHSYFQKTKIYPVEFDADYEALTIVVKYDSDPNPYGFISGEVKNNEKYKKLIEELTICKETEFFGKWTITKTDKIDFVMKNVSNPNLYIYLEPYGSTALDLVIFLKTKIK